MTTILEALEVETESEIETKLVTGIETLLDIISITSQYRRENNQKS